MSQWYDKTAAQTLAGLESGRSGLSPQEAQARLDKYGPTSWPGPPKSPSGPGSWTRCATP